MATIVTVINVSLATWDVYWGLILQQKVIQVHVVELQGTLLLLLKLRQVLFNRDCVLCGKECRKRTKKD